MNLSARLGTAANLGHLAKRQIRSPLIQGNLLLLQVQALFISAVAAFLAFLLARVLPPLDKMPLEMPQDSLPSNMSAVLSHLVKSGKYITSLAEERGSVDSTVTTGGTVIRE
jgi:cation transporter-like permease